jgi:hypothetical protein
LRHWCCRRCCGASWRSDIVVGITVESPLIDIVMERYDAGIRVGSPDG